MAWSARWDGGHTDVDRVGEHGCPGGEVRAEDHHQTYDVVVARAVAPLDRLIGWCNPLRTPDGVILALKGSSAADELAAAKYELEAAQLDAEVLTVRAHPDAEAATVVRLSGVSRDA